MKLQVVGYAVAVLVSPPVWVAWIEIAYIIKVHLYETSPPVWVAWIEIDRRTGATSSPSPSPPVWVAWIEILPSAFWIDKDIVATRMGGVD